MEGNREGAQAASEGGSRNGNDSTISDRQPSMSADVARSPGPKDRNHNPDYLREHGFEEMQNGVFVAKKSMTLRQAMDVLGFSASDMRPLPSSSFLGSPQVVHFGRGHCVVDYLDPGQEVTDPDAVVKVSLNTRTVRNRPLTPRGRH